jgi:hypothetical protein
MMAGRSTNPNPADREHQPATSAAQFFDALYAAVGPGNTGAQPSAYATAWPHYALDAFQRSVLFLDLLRKRGNEQEEITSDPSATVLRFEHEIVMDGSSLQRPINYFLARIVADPAHPVSPGARPVIVVDPRAGQGPGIGGFKAESEIGDALAAGHPVYFIGFTATPQPGQQFLDVVSGQVAFFERVRSLHREAPLPLAIGNCQAGYQTLMAAMLRPDLFGPLLIPGSPMSYWQGVRGKNPMRYSGGLLGGSWLTALSNDLSMGQFDGAWLIMNFDNLNPANWLWGKQYDVYAGIDTDQQRFLSFERWWGDFIKLNGDELQFLVDNLFIGDRLTRNELRSSTGEIFDIRNVASPIIVFTSMGDNISPPQQTLGWILDLYADVDAIRAADHTIVYCLNQTVGHLAIFVSSKVGAKEDEEFVRLIDVIDCLPPGLFEMVIEPRPPSAAGGFGGPWLSRFETRTLDDLRGLGRNSPEDDRAFATAKRVSETNLALYRALAQPMVQAIANQPAADLAYRMNPLRVGYTFFSDKNPWMSGVRALAETVDARRAPVDPENPYLGLQQQFSQQVVAALDAYRDARDRLAESTFFSAYGNPVVQALFGIDASTEVRTKPGTTAQELEQLRSSRLQDQANLKSGGADEALARAVAFVLAGEGIVDERTAFAFGRARKSLMHLSLDAFKQLIRRQARVLSLGDAAVEALPALVASPEDRQRVLDELATIAAAAGGPDAAIRARLARIREVLSVAP